MIRKALHALWADESGLETVEYAVMAALIVAGLVVSVGILGGSVKTKIDGLNTAISGGGGSGTP